MQLFCDLHMHSTASDGTDAPEDLPRLCRDAGLSAFALTDHDTIAGLAACAAAAKRLKIDFVPGIEFSANPDLDHTGRPVGSLHILGHFIDPEHPTILETSARMLRTRADRNPQIIAKLNQLGVQITYDEVLDLAADLPGSEASPTSQAAIGRPHLAQVLLNKGYVKSIHEAFSMYLGVSGEAYVRRDTLSAEQAIAAIHDAGGRATLAHPVQLKLVGEQTLEQVLDRLVSWGLDGLETSHSDHTPADVGRFSKLAERFNLTPTGGSDYHGSRKTIALNSQRVPITVYEHLRDAAAAAVR